MSKWVDEITQLGGDFEIDADLETLQDAIAPVAFEFFIDAEQWPLSRHDSYIYTVPGPESEWPEEAKDQLRLFRLVAREISRRHRRRVKYLAAREEAQAFVRGELQDGYVSRRAAKYLLSLAVRRGEIQRPAACEACGKRTKRLQGHHPWYDEPYNVVWLCVACHADRHHPRRVRRRRSAKKKQ